MTTTYGEEFATVEEIVPRKLVKIGPPRITPNDVLELAEALIEEGGWRKTHGQSDDPSNAGGPEGAPYTIHRAIGEAARRATDSHAKDADAARKLRDAATAQIVETHGGRDDIQLNDEARCNKRRAIRVLQHARGANR